MPAIQPRDVVVAFALNAAQINHTDTSPSVPARRNLYFTPMRNSISCVNPGIFLSSQYRGYS